MRSTWLRAGVVSVAALGTCSGVARAQQRAITIRDVSGEIGTGFDGSWISFPGGSETTKRTTFREWVTLQVVGDILDPRFLGFNVMVRPTLLQLDWSGPITLLDGDGDRFDLNAGIRLLPSRPVSLSGGVFRSSGTIPGAFGRETDFETTEWRGDLALRIRYLPIQVSFRDRSVNEIQRSPAQPRSVRQDADVQSVSVLAQNSKTRLFWERTEYDDRAGGDDFTTHTATLDHQLRWGKGSRLASALRYIDRSGIGAYEQISWEESAHLQHTWSVESDYRYGQIRQEVPGNTIRGKFGDVGFTVRPLPRLELGAEFHGQSNRFADGKQTYYRWGPRASYRTTLPGHATLALGTSLGFERVRQDATNGRIPVVNERHVIDASGRFLLDNADVEVGSVALTDASETLVYQSGFDYQLLVNASLIEVLVLPAGRIAAGDTVLVDYTFLIFPEGRTDALLGQYSASLGLGPVSLYHRRTVREEDARDISRPGGVGTGAASIFNIADRDDMTTGVRVRQDSRGWAVELMAERGKLESNEFEFLSTRVRGMVAVPLRRNLRGTIGGDWSSSESGSFTREVWTANSTIEWLPTEPLRLRSTLTAWKWTETGGNRQAFVGGTLEANWRIRLATVELRYDHNVWQESFENTVNRLFVRLVRSF